MVAYHGHLVLRISNFVIGSFEQLFSVQQLSGLLEGELKGFRAIRDGTADLDELRVATKLIVMNLSIGRQSICHDMD